MVIACLTKTVDKGTLGFITSESNSKAVCIATILSLRFLIEDDRFFIAACNAWQRQRYTNINSFHFFKKIICTCKWIQIDADGQIVVRGWTGVRRMQRQTHGKNRQTDRQTGENLPQHSGNLLQLTLSEKKQVYFRTSRYKLSPISFLSWRVSKRTTSFIHTNGSPLANRLILKCLTCETSVPLRIRK